MKRRTFPSGWDQPFAYKNGLIVVRVNSEGNAISVIGRDFNNLDAAETCMEDSTIETGEMVVLFDMERMDVIGRKYGR